MTWWIIIAVIGFLAMDLLIVWSIIRFGWGGLPDAFPARAPAADAVRKPFQSFRVNALNFGFSIHVAVDERDLHLRPARGLRWFGARTASIPWEAVEVRESGPRWTTVRAGGHTIKGPTWCLSLAGTPD